ncbi:MULTISPECIES: MarR family winged helix-turn-helix transcriptional regulator [Fusobacterium]|jgi:DNA-binding MarR family transcriptional regulator|uniref:Homoprotocatechuate degradation operon regulator, HpaR n=2 Tax=Fusobacterium ulcerans TaxID=861 RepID=A0AAX2JE42_9FUSO|nr:MULTISPECIES: MarR family transcriptional regulator [Fusobacterium]AVQ27435.1 MarR family transcriptional regulator [Fusobacterium ulcerans]EFS26850.1 hypothetical protein FUAG_02365 [Fusobacterium ulcerans ATCC 49185]EHO79021.1 hypothetical protein HMPREF0402_02880 [Fusobacterium ulcerans 12-1B]MCB8566517.1 MarR family transcriptional regulator [Fusobacterium ulcerans]MCB8650676.1 MarR family transcriptional regulator [Fusobacterium ulcerans]
MKTDLGFYIKKLENLLQRQAYKAYHGKNDNDYSLMNMWITDFLTDHESKDIFPKDIEEEFFITRATTSKMLALMEKKELIARESVPEDGRLKKIVLLPKGRELQKKCIQMRDKIEEKLTVNLTEEEKKQFLIISKKIIDGMS